MIELDHVTKRFGDGPATVTAVDDLSLTVRTGEVVALVGQLGFGQDDDAADDQPADRADRGRIVDRRPGRVELPTHELRRGIGYVIQQAGLFPHRTVIDNVVTVPRLLGWDRRDVRARALELLELVGLDPAIADRYPAQLSGGQQQRVGVARALAADPPVLLMDEPFGAVDPIVRAQLQREFVRLQRELGKTVVFVTHDVDEAMLSAIASPCSERGAAGPARRLRRNCSPHRVDVRRRLPRRTAQLDARRRRPPSATRCRLRRRRRLGRRRRLPDGARAPRSSRSTR